MSHFTGLLHGEEDPGDLEEKPLFQTEFRSESGNDQQFENPGALNGCLFRWYGRLPPATGSGTPALEEPRCGGINVPK